MSRSGKYGYNYGTKYSKDKRPWKNKSRTDINNKIKSYIAVFFLSFVFVASILFNSLFVSFFNNSRIADSLCTDKIYSLVSDKAQKGFSSILKDNNIPFSVVSNVLDNTYTEKDMKVFVGNSDGVFDKFDLSARQAMLRTDIENYYESQNIKITKSVSANIDKITDELLDTYASCINLSFWPRYLAIRQTVSTYTFYAEIVIVILVAALCLWLLTHNRKYIHRFHRYMCESCWTAALSLTVLSVIIRSFNPVDGTTFSETQYGILFDGLNDYYCNALLIFAAVALCVGILFFIYTLKRRKQLVYRCSHKTLSSEDAAAFHKDIVDFIENGNAETINPEAADYSESAENTSGGDESSEISQDALK